MDFIFKHVVTGEIKTISLTEKEIQERLEDDLNDEILDCDCQSIGETNVVECNCTDFFEGFRLQKRVKK